MSFSSSCGMNSCPSVPNSSTCRKHACAAENERHWPRHGAGERRLIFLLEPADRSDLGLADLVGHQQRDHRRHERDRQDERAGQRSEEHTSELQSLMRISYAVFCLKKKKQKQERLKHIKDTPIQSIMSTHK